MALPINRITNPDAVGVDGNLYPEWRVQALWHVWLKFYFSGVDFSTRAVGGGLEQRRFHQCSVVFQEAESADREGSPQSFPEIHGVLQDQRARAIQESDASHGEDLDWVLNLMVKVPKNLSGTGQAAAHPKFLCREVGGQLAWLVRSAERAALSEHGIHNLELRSGPSLIASSPWIVRMLVINFRTRRLTPRL
jgi:hypothetical protein